MRNGHGTMIESVRIQGFRSLADVEISGMPRAAVLIGANGSGKSNFIRFFEMLSWMIKSRQLGEFIAIHGGADDQLFGGNRVTPRMECNDQAENGQVGRTTTGSPFPTLILIASSSATSASDTAEMIC